MYIDKFASPAPEELESCETFGELIDGAYEILACEETLGNVLVRCDDGVLHYLHVTIELVPVCDLPAITQEALLEESLITPADL